MSTERKLEIVTNEHTLVMLIDYETKGVEMFNGDGEPLHIEGEIDKGDGYMKINLRVDVGK